MIIYGTGGHAKVIHSILTDSGQLVTAVFDDDLIKKSFLGLRISGRYDADILPAEKIVIGVGNNNARRAIVQRIVHEFGNAIHPSAILDYSVTWGIGLAIMHRAVIQAGSAVGNHNIINTGAIVEHECRLSDFVHIGPGATLCGNVTVGENALIGAGSVILPNISIGNNCIIGAGSVITRDIPNGAIVRGNPGRIIKS